MLLERLTRALQVRGRDAPAAHRLPRDDHRPAEGHHRHKKQTGGAGQFGEVFLRIEPLPRGAGFEFVDEVMGGTIPGQFIPAVEKGVRQVLAGRRDRRLPGAGRARHRLRRQAPHRGQQGNRLRHRRQEGLRRRAIREARPIVLEPIVHIEISAPAACMGDITGDLSTRRARSAARTRCRAGARRSRPGAAVGAAGLPVAAEGDDRRPGPLHHGAEPLRPGAGTHVSRNWWRRTSRTRTPIDRSRRSGAGRPPQFFTCSMYFATARRVSGSR